MTTTEAPYIPEYTETQRQTYLNASYRLRS
jgi:hypothetical protein